MDLVITTRAKPVTARHGKSHHGPGTRKFIAVDGEGVTLPNGEHRYVLLRIGTEQPLENPDGLSWSDIFEYLYSHFRPGNAYVGFYLGYDFTQWFKSLPANRAGKLLTKEGVASRRRTRKNAGVEPFPVECGGWQFDIMSGRRVRIRPKICDCTLSLCACKPKPPWMYICDAGGFFQTSFLVAINPAKWPEPILSDEEFEQIKTGKERRAGAVLDDDMRFYNRLENDVMARLMTQVDEGIRKLGVTLSPRQWFSPAQAAQKWMRGRVPDRETINENVPEWYRYAARASYIAGWFEIMMHGPIPGTMYQYDINSAYPHIAYRLPCLLHGKYTQGIGKPPEGQYVLCHAEITVPKHEAYRYIGPMMFRTRKGKICRPVFWKGWAWLPEIRASERAGCARVTRWLSWVAYEPCDCPSPLRELRDLYRIRLEQGKNTPLGRGARLVYNCVYGKLAQNVGDPEFMNFIYASLITSGCRTQILDAIATHPVGKAAVIQVATDAVYFMSPHPGLPISDKLGEWDETQHTGVTIFKPGMYWDDKAREMIADCKAPEFKARGVNAADMASRLAEIDRQFASWNGSPPPVRNGIMKLTEGWPKTEFVPSFQMVTARQALQRKRWDMAGALLSEPVKQSCNPGDKRDNSWYDPEYHVYRTEPIRYAGDESEVYDSRFDQTAMDNPMSDDNRDRWGVTPDGMIDQLLVDAMMPDRKAMPNVEPKASADSGTKRAIGRRISVVRSV